MAEADRQFLRVPVSSEGGIANPSLKKSHVTVQYLGFQAKQVESED